MAIPHLIHKLLLHNILYETKQIFTRSCLNVQDLC